jgi:hypothetical protein
MPERNNLPHRGEIVKKAVDESGMPKTEVCERTGIDSSKLYRIFHNPFASFDDIIKIGKAIRYNFSKHFPEIKDPDEYLKDQENLDYKFKYFDLLEKYTRVLEEKTGYGKKKVNTDLGLSGLMALG